MADEPTTPKTEEATDKVDEPAAKADEPADQPAAKADEPADQPAAKADEPADQPAAKADEPADQPAAKADEPADQPAAKADEPVEKVDEPAAKADEPVEKVEESVEKMDGSSSKAEESSATSDDQSSPTDQSSTTSNESPVKKKEVSEKKPAASTAKKAESSSSAVRGVRLQKREVPIKSIKDVRPVLQEALKQLKYPLIKKLEAQTGMKREMLFYIACGFIAFFLMFGPCNEAICNLIGIAYPAHQSLMAVRSKTKADDTQWLMYWCSFALFSLCDFILTPFVGPLFVLLKVTCLLYLAVPQTYGAHNFYVSCVDPLMDWAAKRIKI